ncbi:hypothetical protein BH23PAT1_BH23PAT1_1490 [soil metagenome]
MKKATEGNRLLAKPKRYTSVVLILVVVAGVMGSVFAAISMDLRNRDSYMNQAQTVAQTMPLEELKSLQGFKGDTETPAYASVKGHLTQVMNSNPEIRLAYVMGKEGDNVFFYADSESESSVYYSAPGQIYNKVSPTLVSAFAASDKPFYDGALKNRHGTWRSAMAPVKDPATGKVLAMIGLNSPASSYYFQLFVYSLVPLLLAAIPLAGLIRDRKLEAKEREILGLKSQFVSIASHELRSPLNGMLWAIQSMLKKSDAIKEPEENELLIDMYRSAESSLATVNEILDFSVFERGKEGRAQKELIDLSTVLDEVQNTLKLGGAEKNLIIKRGKDWPDKIIVRGDVAALKRSFMNIVSNAIKYSPDNSDIKLTYEQKDNLHVVSVADKGIGIPKSEQGKVLEGYYRATNAQKVQAHGTGLGLWVSKMVLEEHGGSIRLDSSEEHGTTVHMALPVAELNNPADEKTNPRQ